MFHIYLPNYNPKHKRRGVILLEHKTMRRTQWKAYARQLLLATAAGLVSSAACVVLRLFFWLLQAVFTGHAGLLSQSAAQLSLSRRAITPVIGAALAVLTISLYRKLNPQGRFQEYIEAIRLHQGKIALRSTLWRTLSSAFSVATGATIGREGSMIQFAASVTSWLGQRLRIPVDFLPRLVASGVAAAVATVYQAPLAGIFFAAEIVLGRIVFAELPYLSIAAFTGVFISRSILGGGPIFHAIGSIDLNGTNLCFALILAALLGALGPVYQWCIHSMQFAKKLPFALLWSGIAVGILSLYRTEVWGNGDAALLHLMQTSPTAQATLFILLLRLCATILCVGTGTVGGVFTPTLFAGAAIGLLFSHLLHLTSPLLFTVLAMACLLAAVTHAPWMAMLMAVELTGEWPLLPLLLVSSLIAWQVARRLSPHSLYALATPDPIAVSFDEESPNPAPCNSPASQTEVA
jgi:CIC family chloride channel protein